MTKSLKGTKTEINLATAFAGECMARTRYTFFASKAKKEGYEQISEFFMETAENEKEHAKIFLKFLEDSGLEIPATPGVPNFTIRSTLDNLKFSASGENAEWKDIYPSMAATAEAEGFPKIAQKYRMIASIEQHHEERFNHLAQQVENNTFFKRSKETQWKCRNCGYIFTGLEAPTVCPVCAHPQSFFQTREVLE